MKRILVQVFYWYKNERNPSFEGFYTDFGEAACPVITVTLSFWMAPPYANTTATNEVGGSTTGIAGNKF